MPSDLPIPPAPVLVVVALLLLCALLLATLRALRGPSVADRVTALDLLGAIFMGACVMLAMLSQRELYLDVALAVAVVAFIGTIAFSRQIEE